MSPALKFLIGLAAVAGMAAIGHGPAGQGAAFVGGMEDEARAAVAATNVPDIDVRMGRDPLTRLATASGPADAFQREGQGELKGISDRIREVEGVSGVRWADEPERFALPLFVETLILALVAYLIGLGLAWLLWGRPKRQGFY